MALAYDVSVGPRVGQESEVTNLLLYYSGYVFGVGTLAFGVIWWRHRAHLGVTVGFWRLIGLYLIVIGTCFVTFAILGVATTISGYSNLVPFEQPFAIVSGLLGYFVGNSAIVRHLRSKGQSVS